MPGYVIAEVDVHDPERYEEYRRMASAAVAEFGGRFVVRGGPAELLEGQPEPKRIVVLEFESTARAKEWYESEAYRPALELRQSISTGRFLLVEGYEG